MPLVAMHDAPSFHVSLVSIHVCHNPGFAIILLAMHDAPSGLHDAISGMHDAPSDHA